MDARCSQSEPEYATVCTFSCDFVSKKCVGAFMHRRRPRRAICQGQGQPRPPKARSLSSCRNLGCYQRRWPTTTTRRVPARSATAETAAACPSVCMLCGWARGRACWPGCLQACIAEAAVLWPAGRLRTRLGAGFSSSITYH